MYIASKPNAQYHPALNFYCFCQSFSVYEASKINRISVFIILKF